MIEWLANWKQISRKWLRLSAYFVAQSIEQRVVHAAVMICKRMGFLLFFPPSIKLSILIHSVLFLLHWLGFAHRAFRLCSSKASRSIVCVCVCVRSKINFLLSWWTSNLPKTLMVGRLLLCGVSSFCLFCCVVRRTQIAEGEANLC